MKQDNELQILWRDDDGFIAQGTGDNYKTFADTNVNDDDIDDREKRTDDIIAAYNGTIAKGYNPVAMEELYNVLIDALVGLESAKDSFELENPNWGNTTIEKVKTALQNAKTIKP